MSIEVTRDTFRLAQVFTISRGSRTEAKVLTVKVTRGGVTGWGECVPYARYDETLESVEAEIASLPEGVSREALQGLLPPGAARNAVDCALWDLEAKQAGLSIFKLIGLPSSPVVTVNTVTIDTPGKMANKARAITSSQIKVKLDDQQPMERIAAVRNARPDADIVVDVNEGWRFSQLVELAPQFKALGIEMIEQPLPRGEDEALEAYQSPIVLCADESCLDTSELEQVAGRYQMVNIKLDKTGGLTEALALRDEALKEGYKVMVGCMVGSSLAMAPATLVAQGALVTDLDGPLLLAEDRVEPLKFDEAGVHPPEPGLWG